MAARSVVYGTMCLFLSVSISLAGDVARGVVYHDVNRNGVRDAGERGLPGVRVSNGRILTKTNAQGQYELPISDDTTIFIVKPRDYATRIDGLNLPRFYHHHVPAGTPDGRFIFKGIAPTGPLPESIDFPLYHRPEPDRFSVVLFGDPQAYTVEELAFYARDVVGEFARLRDVAFGIALGDLVGDNLALLDGYNQANAQAGFPWYNVIGNHDLNFMALDDRHSDATFRRVFGPSTYMFQYGRAHFIVLNNIYWKGFEGLRRDGWPRRGQYAGRIRPEHLELIRAYVAEVPTGEAIVVAAHIPFQNLPDAGEAHATPEYGQLLEILSGHPHTFSVSGHTHLHFTSVAGADRGYRAPGGAVHFHHNISTISGTWYAGPPDERGVPLAMQRDGTPRGYVIAEFDGPRHRVRYQALGRPATEQMRIHAPEVVERSAGTIEVQANIFDGSERSTTRVRIMGQGDWVEMRQAARIDPIYETLHAASVAWAAEREGRRPLSAPVATPHHWVASIDVRSLSDGAYTLEVETVDGYGQAHHGRHALRVVEDLETWKALDRTSTRTPRQRIAAQAE